MRNLFLACLLVLPFVSIGCTEKPTKAVDCPCSDCKCAGVGVQSCPAK